MKMDSSQWIDLNPNIKIIPSNRKFYNQYPYKITFYVIKAYALRMANDADHLEQISKLSRHKPSWLDSAILNDFFRMYQSRQQDFRFRCEGDSISIFSENEYNLYDLVISDLSGHTSRLESITRIMNDKDREVIESDKIIMRTPTEFRYKVMLRSGFKNINDRRNLAKYLLSIQSEIKISDLLLHGMLSQYKYLTSCYFYVNDPKIVSMIALVAPNIVKRVQEVVVH